MIVGIDASSICKGGGLNHLIQILTHLDPAQHGIGKVVIWINADTAKKLPDRKWLIKESPSVLSKNFLWRAFWQRTQFPKLYQKKKLRYPVCNQRQLYRKYYTLRSIASELVII